ncbi:MAG: response regulator transcription factor [Rikenellaceae bacterium]|nr:response regulator transcription factor [Rikenellaceae bacterium]
MSDRRSAYKVVVVEPSAIVSEGLRTLIAANSEFKVAEPDPRDCRTVMERLPLLAPDILVINPQAIDFVHRRALRKAFPALQQTALVAVVHSVFEEETLREFDATINIYDPAPQLRRKLHQALEQRDTTRQNENYELSEREREILISIARGMTNKEIADKHNISIHTVISHRKNITRKTGIKSIAGLTVYAMLNNMIDQSEL